MGDGAKKGAFEVEEGELLLEDVCGVFEEERRKEAVLRVCESKGEEAGEADLSAEKKAWRSWHCL